MSSSRVLERHDASVVELPVWVHFLHDRQIRAISAWSFDFPNRDIIAYRTSVQSTMIKSAWENRTSGESNSSRRVVLQRCKTDALNDLPI